MTRLLEKAVAAVAALPDALQDEAAFLLLQFAAGESSLELGPEDEAALAASLDEEARGEFATEEEVQAIWAKRRR